MCVRVQVQWCGAEGLVQQGAKPAVRVQGSVGVRVRVSVSVRVRVRVRVRVKSNEFLVYRGGDVVEIVVADLV